MTTIKNTINFGSSISKAVDAAFNTKCRQHAVFTDIVNNYDILKLENRLLREYNNKDRQTSYCDAVLAILIDDRLTKGESAQQSADKADSAIRVIFKEDVYKLCIDHEEMKDIVPNMFMIQLTSKFTDIMQEYAFYVKSIVDIISLKDIDDSQKTRMIVTNILNWVHQCF